MTLHLIGRPGSLSSPAHTAAASAHSHARLRDLLRANTVIGVFEEERQARRFIERAEQRDMAVRIWKLQGASTAQALQREWSRRPLLRRLLSFSDEGRLVEDLVRYLARGETVLALRGLSASTLASLLPEASHVIHVGAWTFRFVR